MTDFSLQPSTPVFDFDIERDQQWPLPQAKEWKPEPKPSVWERLVARFDREVIGEYGDE
jgi:hypothetical protein